MRKTDFTNSKLIHERWRFITLLDVIEKLQDSEYPKIILLMQRSPNTRSINTHWQTSVE